MLCLSPAVRVKTRCSYFRSEIRLIAQRGRKLGRWIGHTLRHGAKVEAVCTMGQTVTPSVVRMRASSEWNRMADKSVVGVTEHGSPCGG